MQPVRGLVLALFVLSFVCVSLLGVATAEPQAASPPTTVAPAASGVANPKPWLDHWRLSTFSFGKVSKDTNDREFFEVIGTGVAVSVDAQHGYIVTAKHVFYDPNKNWHPSELRIRFAWEEQKSVYDDFGAIFKLRDEAGTDLWVSDSDGSDVAALPTQPHPPEGSHSQEAIPVGDFANSDDLFEGGTVVVLGYPGIVGNEYLVKAIVRTGIVSWADPLTPFEKPFLIDANIYPGNSGGPVVKVPIGLSKTGAGGPGMGGLPLLPKLLGIVSQAPGQVQDINLRVPGVMLPLALHQVVPFGGTGVIVPISKVVRLLESLKPSK